MKKQIRHCLIFALLATFSLAAVQPYQAGKITSVDEKVRSEVLYYIVNTPITRDHPYYEVTVQAGDTQYLAEYTPRREKDGLPGDIKIDSEIQFSVEDHHMYIKREAGNDLDLIVVKHKTPKR
jgi:hypothetical protein